MNPEELVDSENRRERESSLLNVDVVAGKLSCSPRHVYRLSDAGKIPSPLKLGSLVRWSRKAIDEWIDAGCPPCRKVVGR